MGALAGRRILVTRPAGDAGSLVALLRAEGAQPIEAPTVEIVPPVGDEAERLGEALRDLALGGFSWVVFTSARAVDAVLKRLEERGYPRRAVRARVAAVGRPTADRLAAFGVGVELVPEEFTTAALARAFPEGAGRVLLPRADIAPPDLEEELAAKGWTPVRVTAYSTRFPERLPWKARRALEGGRVDAVAFTSASTVVGFARMAGVGMAGALKGPKVVCIGPVTARAAQAAGLGVDAVAEPHTVEGLVRALERVLGETG